MLNINNINKVLIKQTLVENLLKTRQKQHV
jgi:hypothetical protein